MAMEAKATNDLRSPFDEAGVDPQQSSRFPMGEDVTERFNVHNLGDDLATRNWMALMRRTYAEAARELCLRLSPSRERSMALTKLEEAMFWTSEAAAREHGTPAGYGDIPTGDGTTGGSDGTIKGVG